MSEPLPLPPVGTPLEVAPVGQTLPPMDPDVCWHYRIDNETACCVTCGEQMIAWHLQAQTVLSAPNLNPCTNPEHLAAIARGETVECDAQYVPGTAVPVLIGYQVDYECRRCSDGGTIIAGEVFTAPCGRSHRGDLIRTER